MLIRGTLRCCGLIGRPKELCLHETGLHIRHMDTERLHFLRKRLGDRFHSVLGSTVNTGQRAYIVSAKAADIEDMPVTLRPHLRKHTADHIQRTEHIDVKFLPCIGIAHFLNCRKMGKSGIIYHNIDPSEFLCCLSDRVLHIGFLFHIHGKRKKKIALRSDGFFQTFLAAACSRDGISLCDQFLNQSFSKSLGTSCYQPYFFTHVLLLSG